MKKEIEEVLDYINEMNPEALYPTDMGNAVIGVVERFGQDPLVLLDREKCIRILMGNMDDDSEQMTREEAEEYFQYNTIGAWMGEGTPCFATLTEDLPI